LLDRVKFPAIRTLDTSKTPQAGDIRITAPVLASADLAKIAKQIQAIQATQDGKAKRPAKAAAAKPSLVPVQPQPARRPSNEVTATAPAQLGAAILAARTTAGLSQTALGTKLKMAQANIARLEKGGSIPSTTTLQRIAKATGHKLVITFSRDT
jgi:ribosome-binding protein aMBF1 (putative translation factor)